MTNPIRKNPVQPGFSVGRANPRGGGTPYTGRQPGTPSIGGVAVAREPGTVSRGSEIPPYTAEPDPPRYVNEVWPDGGISGPDAIPVVYGERIVQGRVVSQFGSAGPAKAGVVGLCAGPIDSIVGLWFDDWYGHNVLIPYDAGFYLPRGKDGWTYELGTLSQAAISGTYYGAAQSFPTLAYVFVYIPQFVINGSFVIPQDRPWPGGFRARVKGCKVEDTRTSVTAWSANPSMCLRHFLMSENYGGNVPSTSIDTVSFEAAATYCDTAGFDLNIIIDGNSNAKQWADTIASCFGARIYLKDGKYALWIEGVTADSGILFDTANSRGWALFETPVTERPTRVVVEYSRATNNWAPDQAISEVAGSVAVREASYKLDGVTNAAQAKWLADLYLRTQQTAPWRAEFIASAEAAKLALGTRFKLTFPGGCTAEDFIATEISPQEGGEFKIAAREYDSTSYAVGTVPTPPPAPAPGTLPSDTPPDVESLTSVVSKATTRSPTPDVVIEERYPTFSYVLPDYGFGTDLVVRGLTDKTSDFSSDIAWDDLGNETIIPLTGNMEPGAALQLFWPVVQYTKTSSYFPSLAAGRVIVDGMKFQVTIRLRNILGLLSPGVIYRLDAAVASTSGLTVDPGSPLQTTEELRLVEAPANGVNYWAIKPAAALTADRTLTLPDAAPEAGVMAVDGSGNVSFRKDFSFKAHKNGTDQTGVATGSLTKVTFGTELFDNGAGYDAANSKFIPGVAGLYSISAMITLAAADAGATMFQLWLEVSGSAVAIDQAVASGSLACTARVSTVLSLGATDYVEVFVVHTKAGNGTVLGATYASIFSGARVG